MPYALAFHITHIQINSYQTGLVTIDPLLNSSHQSSLPGLPSACHARHSRHPSPDVLRLRAIAIQLLEPKLLYIPGPI